MVLLPPCPAIFRKPQYKEKRLCIMLNLERIWHILKDTQCKQLLLTNRKACKIDMEISVRENQMRKEAQI
jgi:hypothetical protein